MASIHPRSIDWGLFVIRVGIGLFFAIAHGLPKLMAGPDNWESLGKAIGALGVPVVAPMAFGLIAALTEFLGGLLIAAGLFTRYAAALLLGTMIVASATKVADGIPPFTEFGRVAAHPMEMAVVFLGLLLAGPGRLALQRRSPAKPA